MPGPSQDQNTVSAIINNGQYAASASAEIIRFLRLKDLQTEPRCVARPHSQAPWTLEPKKYPRELLRHKFDCKPVSIIFQDASKHVPVAIVQEYD
jgi:hypothetical protein